MTAKELLLANINALYSQNQGYDTIELALEYSPNIVTLELIDMVCSVVDRLNKEKRNDRTTT